MSDHERDVLFIDANGRCRRQPVYGYPDVWLEREYPRWTAPVSAAADLFATARCRPDPVERRYYRRKYAYPPNWQGPLESGAWWCPAPRRSDRHPMPPGIVMYLFVEALGDDAVAELFAHRWWPR